MRHGRSLDGYIYKVMPEVARVVSVSVLRRPAVPSACGMSHGLAGVLLAVRGAMDQR